MVVEFQVREAINSLVALLRVAEDSAVHHYEQDDAFHPGIFPGLILLARLAADRAGEEFRQATTAAELTRWNANLRGERDHLLQRLTEVTAERDAARQQVAELTRKVGELPAGPVFTMEAFDRAVEFYNECLEQSAEPAPEPDQWQNGDTVRHVERLPSDVPYTVKQLSCGRVALIGLTGMLSQADWEKHGFELHRRASDPPPSPQQVAEFAEATEPIDDSVGADGEGQS